MKAAELISLLAQLSDVKAFLEVYMSSPDIKEKDSVRAESEQIGAVFDEMRAVCQGVLKDAMAQNPFDAVVAFNDSRSLKAVAEATKILEKLKTIPSVQEHVSNIILFRVKFFEFLETEKRQDSLCHQIDEAKANLIRETLENHFYGDAASLAKVTRLSPLLNLYRTAKTTLTIDISTALGFAEDPFSAVHFLFKNLVTEPRNDYVLLEKLTIDFDALYRLIATTLKEMKALKINTKVQKEIEPLLDKLPVPFQRLVRLPLFFQEILKGDRLVNLARFYELHQAKHNQQLKSAISEVQKIAAQMETNVEKVNNALRQREDQQKRDEAKERREHFLAIRAAYEKLRAATPKTERAKANNGEARSVGLVTYHNGGNSKMLEAAHKKDTAAVIKEIEHGADINGRDSGMIWGNYSPLIIGAYNNDVRLVAALLGLTLKLVSKDKNKSEKKEPKKDKQGKKEKKEKAVDLRAQTGTPTSPHDTALHWAVRLGHLEIVEMLTLVDPESTLVKSNKMGHVGFIPLHSAISAGEEEAGIILVKEGSINQILCKNAAGVSPLRMAYDKDQKKLVQKMVDMLLASNDPDHKRALAEFSKHVFGKSKEKKFIGLLYHTVKTNELNLMKAADIGDTKGIAQARSDKVNLECFDPSEDFPGYTPLMFACRGGHLDAVSELLVAHAKPSAQTALGETPLHIAITTPPCVEVKKASAIIRSLISANGTVLTIHENQKGYIPLHTAIESNAPREILGELLISDLVTLPSARSAQFEQDLLHKHHLSANGLMKNSQQEQETKQKQLREMNKHQLRETTKDGVTTPFRLACSLGNVEAARMIFEATLKTKDKKLILHALGYVFLKQKFSQYTTVDAKASEELLKQLDKASAEEIIVLAGLFRHGNELDLINLGQYRRIYIENSEQNYYSLLESFGVKQEVPLSHKGPSRSSLLTLNGELITCVVGDPEADRTWFQATKVSDNLIKALGFEPQQKIERVPRRLNASFWSTPSKNLMEQFRAEIISRYLTAEDKEIFAAEKTSPKRA